MRIQKDGRMTFLEALQEKILFFDGAMGTILQEKGLKPGELPEYWNLHYPEQIKEIHGAYLDAGCNIVKTNTFGANALKIREQDVEEIVRKGVSLAREAVAEHGGEGFVAMDVGPTGKLLRPLGDLSFDRAYEVFAQMCRAGEEAGADLILIETMSDTYEAKAALLAAKENTFLPVVVTMIFDETGKLLTGADIPAAVAMLEGLGADAIGMNCGLGPHQFAELLPQWLKNSSLPVVVNPNAGMPKSVAGKTVFEITPEEFAAVMRQMGEMGARCLGGCCGTTPAHLGAAVTACEGLAPKPITRKKKTVVSSYAKAVEIGKKPVIVGERINPTGKALLKQALREDNIDYILREGLTQQQKGAHILDVNVGLPEINEVQMMTKVIEELQGVCDLPLQIDSSSPEVLEQALRYYNGKAMVNSVNGKKESMEAVFPLVKKYGGVVVALTLDERGIPDTAEGRLEIARKIVETAQQYGIEKKDIVVDALTMTISSEKGAAETTLEAMQMIKKELGVKTILGVSNVSFGLPRREVVNAAFYTMALRAGLDAAIINPSAEAMKNAYLAACALMGYDENYEEYLAAFGGEAPAAKPAAKEKLGLRDAIIGGLKDAAHEAAKELVRKRAALDVINGELIPALDVVGQGFEKGTVFLPRLLMSAEAAKAAFDAIKEHLVNTGAEQEKREPIVIATVKGDIHDIGKNIVKVLLENYGYDVIDLGKDVHEDKIVEAVLKSGAELVGLSALMTTTVANMGQAISALRKASPDCKIMVGGAVLTQEYADQIGADFYGKDAMASVHYAQKLFGYE